MKSNPDRLDCLDSFGNDRVAQDDQNIVLWQYRTMPLKKTFLRFKDHGACALLLTMMGASDIVALQGRCVWGLNMVQCFDRYLFWSAMVHSNM